MSAIKNDPAQGIRKTFKRAPRVLNCYRCGKRGHIAKECYAGKMFNSNKYSVSNRFRSSKVCERCKKQGHNVNECNNRKPRNACYICGEFHWVFDCPHNQSFKQQEN